MAIAENNQAPNFELLTVNGVTVNLNNLVKTNQLIVLAFFKVSCPVCQFSIPFIDKLSNLYSKAAIYAISQDNNADTNMFISEFNLNLPVLIDAQLKSSLDYDLTNVPTVFAINDKQLIDKTIVGFVKADFEYLNMRLAAITKQTLIPLFPEPDKIPQLRPG